MYILIAGLVIFLAVHSVRIFAEDWRGRQIEQQGRKRWMALYGIASIIGFILIVWGYGLARQLPVVLWDPPLWGRHLAIALMAISFFLIAQNGSPQGPIVARVRHPMTAAVGIWSLAHLMANGTLADLLLFGSFLVWAVLAFSAAIRRDEEAASKPAVAGWMADLGPGGGGLAIWLVFLWKAHEWLIGVSPLG
jgi:uncharacterized membrane protein